MSFLRPFFAFLIGLIVLFLTGTKYVILVPAAIIFATAILFAKNQTSERISRIIFLTIISLIELAMFSIQIYYAIRYYPEYGNVLAVGLDITTIFTILGAYLFYTTFWLKR